jgi:molybdate-binding protein/DNA-binding PadR family transcriptional regulator
MTEYCLHGNRGVIGAAKTPLSVTHILVVSTFPPPLDKTVAAMGITYSLEAWVAVAHALLGLLTRGERHGYDLRHELAEEFGSEWRLDFGQLYRLLASMKRKGWVGARLEPGPHGPDRKVYVITARGRVELERWLSEPVARMQRGRDEFAVKLRFGIAGRRAPLPALVDERRRLLESQCAVQRSLRERARHAGDSGRWLLTDARVRQTEAALAALESCAGLLPRRRAAAPERSEGNALVAIGSDDMVLDLLARFFTEAHPEIQFSAQRVGSLAGLLALGEGRAHIAGLHLLDVESGEYNVPFVKHLMPEQRVLLLHLADREQGLMVAHGNPKRIRSLKDLTRRHVQLVNRQRGAGTRLFLFHQLRRARIDPTAIAGFASEVPTHNAVAAAVAAGTADVGPGIRAAADAWGLDFISLGHERYDLAIPRAIFETQRLRAFFEIMHAGAFRQAAAALSGYDVSRIGTIVADIH